MLAALVALLVPGAALAGTAGALPFTAVDGVDQGAADNIASLVSSELDIAGDWELVISAAASEITEGCGSSKSCWQAFGKGEGHDHVITGQVGKAGDEYAVTAFLYEVSSGRLVREVKKTVSRKPDVLLDQIPALATELATGEKVDEEEDASASAKPAFEEPDFDEFEEDEEEAEEDQPKWMNRDRRGRLIKSDDYEEEEDPFDDLGDEDLDLDELDSGTQRKKAEERREREAREAARKAEEERERRIAEEEERRREDERRRRLAEERRREEEERRAEEEERRRRDEEEKRARAERQRREELREQAEEAERRRAAEDRRRREEQRKAEEAEREEEERRRAERSRRDEERRRAEQERAEEERRQAAAERRREEEREAAAEERREEERRAAADRRREEERRSSADRRREEERARVEEDRRSASRYEDEDDDEDGGFALKSAIEAGDDGFVMEDEDPGFVIEDDEDPGFVMEEGDEEEDDGPREGEVVTYGYEEVEETREVSRRRDDYDPYARARSFDRDEDEGSRDDRRSDDRRRSYDDDDEDEDEGDFDELDSERDRRDDRLAYNDDGYPDRGRSYDDDDDAVRARPSSSRDRSSRDRYDDEDLEPDDYDRDRDRDRRRDKDDEFDVSDYGDRDSYRSSSRSTARATKRGPSDRKWVSVRLHGGYTNYYLHFVEYGIDFGVLVHPQIAIDVSASFYSVGLTVEDEASGGEIQQVHTLPNFFVGASWRPDFHKIIKPYVGGGFTSTIYATVRRGTPEGPVEPRASAGGLIAGGVDVLFGQTFGFHAGVRGGVMNAEEISELVSDQWGATQGVFTFQAGLAGRF